MRESPVVACTTPLLALSFAKVESLYYKKAAEDAFIKIFVLKAINLLYLF